MNARLQPSCLQLLLCTVATFLAAVEAPAQTILIQAAATPVPTTPQCASGLILANDATCVLRVETHAGSALRSGAANKYMLAGAVDGILSAVGAAPGPALGQFAVELDGSNFVLRPIGSGKYFLVHGDSFVYADASAPGAATAWVFFAVDSNAAESQVFIFEDGPVSADINVLQYDSVSKNLHVVTLSVADAFNDPNSVFYFSPPTN